MACTTCEKHPQISDPKSTLVIGTDKKKKDPLYKHLKSTSHLACVSQQSKLDSIGNPTATTANSRGILALHEKHSQRLKCFSTQQIVWPRKADHLLLLKLYAEFRLRMGWSWVITT